MRFLKKLLIYITSTVLVLFLAGCSGSKSNVQTTPVKKIVSETVEASGTVVATNTENIVLDFQAKVTAVKVQEGQKLKKGDVILSLDLSDINSQISGKQEEIQAEKQVLEGYEKDKGALSGTADISGTAENYINAQLDNEIQAEKDKISVLQEALGSLQNQLNKPYLKSGNIVCDMDNAVITGISYKKGDIITPSIKIAGLMDLSSLMIQAKVDEGFIKDVKLNSIVSIVPAADESRQYTGRVKFISSEALTENGDTYIPVMISMDNNNGFLLPNFNVDLEISKK